MLVGIKLLKCGVVAALLVPFLTQEAAATHCYIGRSVSATPTTITLNWTYIFQAQTPRMPRGYSIVGAWYSNTTPGGMSPSKCESMVRYKARNDSNAWPNPGSKCVRAYLNGVLVYSGYRCR